jgi:hypothetical protein
MMEVRRRISLTPRKVLFLIIFNVHVEESIKGHIIMKEKQLGSWKEKSVAAALHAMQND